MPMVFSQGDQNHYQQISEDLKKYHLGGIIFSKGTIAEQVDLPIYFKAKVKYLYSSLWMRSGDGNATPRCTPFPYQMTLGAIQNDSLLYQMGYVMANRQRRLGVHLNFSPAMDINTNAKNPVIGLRSLGSDPELVTKRQGCFYVGCKMGVDDKHQTFPWAW